jgi:hypothetical protein
MSAGVTFRLGTQISEGPAPPKNSRKKIQKLGFSPIGNLDAYKRLGTGAISMRITKSKFRQLVQEALLREGVLFDKEEQQAVDLTRELAALYRTLQGSHRTEEVMEMEDAYTKTFQDIKSQKMRQADIYALVGIAKAIVDLGLRSSSKDQEEYKDY